MSLEKMVEFIGPAALVSSLTVVLTIWLQGKAYRRRVCRNTAAILITYIDELKVGLRTMEIFDKEYQSSNVENKHLHIAMFRRTKIPSAFWDIQKLSEDGLGELVGFSQKRSDPEDEDFRSLSKHLKNAFEYVTDNFNDGQRYQDMMVKDGIEGYEKTIRVAESAVKELMAVANKLLVFV